MRDVAVVGFAQRQMPHFDGSPTMVELLVCLLIMAIIMAILLPPFLDQRAKGEDAEAKLTLANLAYNMDRSVFHERRTARG